MRISKYTRNEKERTLHIWIPLFEEKLDDQHFFCEQPHMYLIVWDKCDSKKKCNKNDRLKIEKDIEEIWI